MLKHFFARSSSTSATVKKNELTKAGNLSPPRHEAKLSIQKDDDNLVNKDKTNADSENF